MMHTHHTVLHTPHTTAKQHTHHTVLHTPHTTAKRKQTPTIHRECLSQQATLGTHYSTLLSNQTTPNNHYTIHMHYTTAACLACGNFMSSFPVECQPTLSELLPLFFSSLEDSMPSVRQGAASSLATLVSVYGTVTVCRSHLIHCTVTVYIHCVGWFVYVCACVCVCVVPGHRV